MNLDAKLSLDDVVQSSNLVPMLSKADLATIAQTAFANYQMDLSARSGWETKMKMALELALQVTSEKTFPWSGAANIKFPLITIAALQFHARAYPAMIPGPDIVKCQAFGPDPDGAKAARAGRVGAHMSYQVLEEDESWEDNHDKVLITVPIVGCAFKKTYFDSQRGHNVSENVLAKDLVIPYFAKSLESASRLTHQLEVSHNYMLSMERQGLFTPMEGACGSSYQGGTSVLEQVKVDSQGVTPTPNDPSAPCNLLEQHCWLDLDGDGFEEPYIVTIRGDYAHVCRIVARFTSDSIKRNGAGAVWRIRATNYFTKYPFIPSPDGGIYDLGFGTLLGPLNESINTLINQLVDAGTLANTAGGFLGRGAKLRSGDSAFKPFEWKRVDSSGDDLRKNILPLPTNSPSNVLFSLLDLLINYGERVAGATDPQVGVNPGQNTPAETSRNMVAEGQRVFMGIFKRLHRAMKEEFRKLYLLNQDFLDEETNYYPAASGIPMTVLRQDYFENEKCICPSADPNMVSESQKIMQARFLKEASMTTPGYSAVEVERRFLRALQIPDVDAVYPGPDKVPAPIPLQLQLAQIKAQTQVTHDQMQMRMNALELLGNAEKVQAEVEELRARATKHLADAQGEETWNAVAALQTQIAAAKANQDGLLKAAKLIMDGFSKEKSNATTSNAN